MKKIVFLLCSSLIISCSDKTTDKSLNNETVKSEVETSENFDWLLGDWKRLNNDEGNETFENWKKINDTEYLGIGFTLKNGDTISQEKMELSKTNNQWNIAVSFPTEKNATFFKVTQIEKNSFTCENEQNDFPKKIHYWIENQNLKAIISNDEMEIDFVFERLK
ncbi:DUF6265 family protein [Flavobacterium sp. I3-2]|uniref:DUF6265 family protein n=1 Tax=Flavobacterium sp. I3-2 TaxID=2748319 RepID=UPI002103A18B|nr:DUF6265 family protein [Flavobacterium sp. I3-2]